MLGVIGGFTFLYGALHVYAVAEGGMGWMVLGASFVLCDLGDAPIKSAIVALHRSMVKAVSRIGA